MRTTIYQFFRGVFFFFIALYVAIFFACSSDSTKTKTPCSIKTELIGLWQAQKVLKGNEDVSLKQKRRFLALQENGKFYFELRVPKSFNAQSTVEDGERIFYDIKMSELLVKNSFSGQWEFCEKEQLLNLKANKFRSKKEKPIIDSLKVFPFEIKQIGKDSLAVKMDSFDAIFTRTTQ